MASQARRVVVKGRVQGVFFRDTCQREAQSRGVAGWVRNDEHGSVTAHFEGDAEAVAAMVEWARTGPRRAEVGDVQVREVEPEGCGDFAVQ